MTLGPISPQLQQGIVNLIYFTWLHNAEMLAYFAGGILSLGLLIRHPRRTFILMLLGFIFLMVQFQYIKHIVEPLMAQTLQAVLETGAQATRFQQLTRFILEKAVPIGLYLAGWGSIFLSILLLSRTPKQSPKEE